MNNFPKYLLPAFCLLACSMASGQTIQTLSILGGNGLPGDLDPYTEYFNPQTAAWQPAVLVGEHPWGYEAGTNSWLNYRLDPTSDEGCRDYYNPCTYLYRVRFSAPSAWSNPHMTFSLKADNFGDVRFNGTPVAYIESEGTQQADLVFASAMQPGINTITIEVGDYGGLNGLNYRIDMSAVASQPFATVRTIPLPPVPQALTGDQCKKNGWKALTRANGTGFKNQGDCMQYVNTGK